MERTSVSVNGKRIRKKNKEGRKREPVLNSYLAVEGTELQLDTVAKRIYHLENDYAECSADSNNWFTTDSLFYKAKSAYDGITKPFVKQPDVYKLPTQSTTKKQNDEDPSRFSSNIIEDDGDDCFRDDSLETELQRYINPFILPKPWIRKRDFNGDLVYFNTETKQRSRNHPEDVIF